MENTSKKTSYGEMTKATQEQATGAFVDTLNAIRLRELVRRYAEIDRRKAGADQELESLVRDIKKLIESNRGGTTGMHGFIGERVQVGFCNERAVMQGLKASYRLIDDNGMTDYMRNDILIQQKACQSDKALGLTHIVAHSKKYPCYVEKNGIYQIPKDFYMKMQKFMNMPESEAFKLRKEDLRMWRKVQEFKTAMPGVKVESMVVTYGEIQVGAVESTIEKEKASVQKEYNKQRNEAEYACRPTVTEGIKATAASAAIEGVTDGVVSVLEHKQDGKKIKDFDREDWKEIGIDAAKGAGKGAARGAIVYAATNVAHIPAGAASAAVTGGVVIVENAVKYAKGECDGKECLGKIADGCMLTAVSAVSAEIGKKLIPIPVVGPILGSAIGTGIYKLAKKPILKLYRFFFDAEPCVA